MLCMFGVLFFNMSRLIEIYVYHYNFPRCIPTESKVTQIMILWPGYCSKSCSGD